MTSREPELIVCPTPPDDRNRRCWFCGDPLSGPFAKRKAREHVFARWLLSELDAERRPFAVTWNDALERNVLDERAMVTDAFVAGRVCATCNNGWMSDLERVVRTDLLALARGSGGRDDLDVSSLRNLASWAAKTAFAAQSVAIGPTLVPVDHRLHIRHGDLDDIQVVGRLSDVDLGLNTYGSQRWYVSYPPPTRESVIAAVARSYKVIMTVGHLVLAVCHWPEPKWPLVVSRLSHFAIWPLDRDWCTYGYRTDRRGVAPNATTEIIDMVMGTMIVHPDADRKHTTVSAHQFA